MNEKQQTINEKQQTMNEKQQTMNEKQQTMNERQQIIVKDSLLICPGSPDLPAGSIGDEYVENKENYNELNKIKNWRKILSNDWPCSILYNGRYYSNVAEAFAIEAMLIKNGILPDIQKILRELLYIKFTSNDILKYILLETKNSRLYYCERLCDKYIHTGLNNELEFVRNIIRNGKHM